MARLATGLGVTRVARLIGAVLALQCLTYCSGSTERSGKGGSDGGGKGGAANDPSFSGHTSGSLPPGASGAATQSAGCIGSCGGPCGPCPGASGGGGQAGNAGASLGGFGGHTSGCLGQCGGNCPPCPGGANNGGAPEGGASDGGQSMGGDAPAQQAQLRTDVACYTLSGYESDPCLPPDDSLLPWLSGVPSCDATVTAGPLGVDVRACCYSVACRTPAE